MKKPRQGRHIRGIIWRRMEKELFAEDVAPDGAGKLFGAGFYKDAAPTALGEGGLVAPTCHAEVGRRRK
jgi:hypothetical protein